MHALQSGTDFAGSIYVTIEPEDGIGGVFTATAAASVAPWASEFLRHPDRGDVAGKLSRSGADENHAFLLVPGLTTAPDEVVHALISDPVGVPELPPDLPAGTSDLWVVGTWSSPSGMHWSADRGWEPVDKVLG